MKLVASDQVGKRTEIASSYTLPQNANTHFSSDHVQVFPVSFMRWAEAQAEEQLLRF